MPLSTSHCAIIPSPDEVIILPRKAAGNEQHNEQQPINHDCRHNQLCPVTEKQRDSSRTIDHRTQRQTQTRACHPVIPRHPRGSVFDRRNRGR